MHEVAAGRPFSQLERMLLRAIKEGATELTSLQSIFEVHPRLLIEGLVTLTHAGWLALGGPGREGFVLTSEGREAAGSDRPPSTTEVAARKAFVVMERITGGLISNDDVRFVTRKDLERVWDHAIRLPPEVDANRLDEGQVQHLVPRRRGEWVRWIGPIDMMSKDAHWLPVNVDLDTETVVGLPDQWSTRLRTHVLNETRRRSKSLAHEARRKMWRIAAARRTQDWGTGDPDALRLPPQGWPAQIVEGDLLFTDGAHETLLATALGEARASVFVASAFANKAKLETLRPSFEEALKRGVSLDFLWGYAADGSTTGRETTDWLRRLAYDAKRNAYVGVVRFNQAPSGSHAKLVLWDPPTGFRACVGSYNWLSTSVVNGEEGVARNVSVQLSGAPVIAALARCAAGLWAESGSDALSSTADRWRRIAADLDAVALRSAVEGGNANVRLVLDREHDALLREWGKTSQQRLLIMSHRLGPAAEPRLIAGEVTRLDGFSFRVMYGRQDVDDAGLARVRDLARRCGATLEHLAGLHGKVVVSDASACVSSYNFLSADPFGTAKNARELGVAIDGADIAEWIWNGLR